MPHKDPENRRAYWRRWYHSNPIHRIEYRIKNRNLRESIKKELEEYKRGLSCEMCGESHIACFDFHHEGGDKNLNVSRMASQLWSVNKIMEELEKCRVLCANCHRKLHYEENEKKKQSPVLAVNDASP